MINIADGPLVGGTSVPVWSVLFTENNEGKKDVLVYPDFDDTAKKS